MFSVSYIPCFLGDIDFFEFRDFCRTEKVNLKELDLVIVAAL